MFLNSTILLIYLCWSQSISKMSSPYGPKAASLYSCPCVPISSNPSKLRAISIKHLFVCPCGSINIEQASSIVCPCGLSRTKNCSSAAGVDLWWSANHRMKWFRATFLSPTRGTEGGVKTIERAVGTSLVPWGEKGLGKAVEPSLMVKKDGMILEKA